MTDDLWTVGFHAVLGVLESRQPVDALWIQRGRRDDRTRQVTSAARRRGVRFDLVSRQRLDSIADGAAHNGCAVRSSPIEFVDLDDFCASPDVPARVVVLDDLSDPHNLGAVLRTSAALAIDGVVIAGPSAPPLGGAVSKAAAGLLGRVPIARAKVAADAITRLRNAGFWVFGADAEGTSLHDVSPANRWVLCVGAEKKGLRAKTKSQIDEFVAIPMADGVESLNLSVSAGILLWELSKPL